MVFKLNIESGIQIKYLVWRLTGAIRVAGASTLNDLPLFKGYE